MNIISVSYGNDSVAMLQWAKEHSLEDVHVVYMDTGWAHSSWQARIVAGRTLAWTYGFEVHHIQGEFDFVSMVRMKKGFPFNKAQFCTGILKGLPFSIWCAENDPEKKAMVHIGKRREESEARKNIQEYEYDNEFHEGRVIRQPLYKHTEEDRDKLIRKTGMRILKHRSKECSPCVNSGKKDLLMVDGERINLIRQLEKEVGKNMFRSYRHMGAQGIDEVMRWARTPRGKYNINQLDLFSCESGLCGL